MEDGPSFSVLLPVYAGVDPAHLRRALDSVVDQTAPPDQVVVVADGPLPEALEAVIEGFGADYGRLLTLVRLAENRGAGAAFEAGLSRCRHDIVARMDADDVSLPHRFARQLAVLQEGYDVVGSSLTEFAGDEGTVVGVRRMPTTHEGILRYARFNNPINTPSAMLRRSAVVQAGGSIEIKLVEDYDLFVRMLHHGSRMRNLEEPLVLFRTSPAMYQRRGGRDLLLSELTLQRRLLALGFIGRVRFARNLVVRSAFRLLPASVRRFAYGPSFRWRSRSCRRRPADQDGLQ